MASELQLVLVTPETTLLDEPVSSLQFPLYDGQIGILPGRAPMVGRLGYGELRIRDASGERSYFVDGGFVQVKGPVVSILTNRSMPVSDVDAADAEQQLNDANALNATSEDEFTTKEREVERARRLVTLARKPR